MKDDTPSSEDKEDEMNRNGEPKREPTPRDPAFVANRALRLAVGRYRLLFAQGGTAGWPRFSGSAWRGAFGRALRQTVCVTRLDSCGTCLLKASCAYSYLFETPIPSVALKMRRYPAAPHPFALQIHDATATCGPYILGLSLFGHGNRYLAYVIHAMTQAAAGGIGRRRIRLSLTEVQQAGSAAEDWRTIYTPAGELTPLPPETPAPPACGTMVRIVLCSPLRVQRREALVGPQEFVFADLFGPLLRRLSMLTYFHGDFPLEVDFRGLMEQARQVSLISTTLRWHDWIRYSSRQQTTMQMGGLIGEFALDGGDIGPFWPYLWAGQWTHVGKGTTMGLGQYTIILEASLPNRTELESEDTRAG
jgi:hypothetical protein